MTKPDFKPYLLLRFWHTPEQQSTCFSTSTNGRKKACVCQNYSINMSTALLYFAVFTFLHLKFSLTKYSVSHLKMIEFPNSSAILCE